MWRTNPDNPPLPEQYRWLPEQHVCQVRLSSEAVAASIPLESEDGSVFGGLVSLVDHSLPHLAAPDAPPDNPPFPVVGNGPRVRIGTIGCQR